MNQSRLPELQVCSPRMAVCIDLIAPAAHNPWNRTSTTAAPQARSCSCKQISALTARSSVTSTNDDDYNG